MDVVPDAAVSAIPDTQACFTCQKRAVPLHFCAKCRVVVYCSKDCQRRDWKTHKLVCAEYSMSGLCGGSGEQTQMPARATDLQKTLEVHEGTTFGPLVWFAMDLANHPERSNTHFIAVLLARNRSPSGPRTLHSFIDADVLPLSLLSKRMVRKEDGTKALLVERFAEGVKMALRNPEAIGKALLVCVEVDGKSRERNIAKVVLESKPGSFSSTSFPLEKSTDALMRMMPAETTKPEWWKRALKNALDGYTFLPTREAMDPSILDMMRRGGLETAPESPTWLQGL
ncbi:MYND-type domain-containing protein [Mycena kentingensis (nom. inval.)]|nr:MYND-type domain-containing protein [Mycena kentingensis (nom. inval.)]